MFSSNSIRLLVIVFSILILASIGIFAHSGGTDKFGGHRDRKRGGYHYHNAGYAHAAGNPNQDHTKCGVCSTSKKIAIKKSSVETVSQKETILALQLGLKCLGYKISTVDGVLGNETEKAIKELLREQNSSQKDTK